MIIKYPLTDHFTNFYIGPNTQRVFRGPVRPLYYGVVSNYDYINILLMAGRYMKYILTIIIIIGSITLPQKLPSKLIQYNSIYTNSKFSSEIINNSTIGSSKYTQRTPSDAVIYPETQGKIQDDNGNNGPNWLEVFDGADAQNSNYSEDSDEDGDMDMYQSTTITLNNMGSWLNNVNNMLNANNLTTVTDISKSNNNNTLPLMLMILIRQCKMN